MALPLPDYENIIEEDYENGWGDYLPFLKKCLDVPSTSTQDMVSIGRKTIFDFPEYTDYERRYPEMVEKARNAEEQYPTNPTVAITWRYLRMPEENFHDFTAVTLRNNARQGLFHAVIRHYKDWVFVIDDIEENINQLPQNFRDLLENIVASSNIQDPSLNAGSWVDWKCYEDCMAEYNQLDKEHKKTLSQLQEKIFEFLKDSITDDNYRGQTRNGKGQIQHQFDVKGLNGERYVLILCPGKEIYDPQEYITENFDDARYTRAIITFYLNTVEIANRKEPTLYYNFFLLFRQENDKS